MNIKPENRSYIYSVLPELNIYRTNEVTTYYKFKILTTG